MLFRELGLLRRQGSLLFHDRGRQLGLADVLQQAEQSEQLELLARQLQEAREHDHVDGDLQRAGMRRRALFAQLGDQEQRVGIAHHAVGKARHRFPDFPALQDGTALGERPQELVHGGDGLRVDRGRALHLGFDTDRVGIGGVAADLEAGQLGARARAILELGLLHVDEDVLAEFLQGLQLLVGAQVKALEHEGRIGPRAIELGDVHAELQLSHRHLFPLHRLILAARTPRRARRDSPRRAESPHR